MIRTLADLQRAPGAPVPDGPAGLPLDVQAVRTFDTPEFAGMTFHEVETRSALNRVSGMPFGWSINPYRGCSHACSYCLDPSTPVLMAGGRHQPIGTLRAGDGVVGTRIDGRYRRYTSTVVRDVWRVRRPAFEVICDDGSSFIASGAHRIWTHRGWRHVTGTCCGAGQRSHLTVGTKLLGLGSFAPPPEVDRGYRTGYLAGVIRGDGHVGTYSYERSGRSSSEVHRFRLAMADGEALDRAAAYLETFGVVTQRFLFAPRTPTRRPIEAIRVSAEGAVDCIRQLIELPHHPDESWLRGYLAGIWDAEGTGIQHVLRIFNSDERLLAMTERALDVLGARHVREVRPSCGAVRVTGGLAARLRLAHAVDPAIARKHRVEGVAMKGSPPRTVIAIEPVGERELVDITTGTGDYIADGAIHHNCFARPTHRYLNLSPLGDFERQIVVKTNVAEVLRRELAKPSWRGEHVAMGTNTDPYQRAEGRYRLMPAIIRNLAESRTSFSILTKGTLITRDLDELVAAAQLVEVGAALTVGMLDRGLWRSSEPGVPSPRARLDAVAALAQAGIPTGVMLAPIMPGLNDDHEQLSELVDAAAQAGAAHITPIVLHLRGPVKDVFWPWLSTTHPELVDRYHRWYARSGSAPKGYVEGIRAFVAERRAAAWRRWGRPGVPPSWRGDDPEDRRAPVAADPATEPAATAEAATQPRLW